MAFSQQKPSNNITPLSFAQQQTSVMSHNVTLGVYGPGATGKTSMLAALLEAGHTVYYVCTQSNTQPFENMSDEAKSRLFMIKVWDTPTNANLYRTMVHFYRTYRLNVCAEHGINKCDMCAKAQAPIYDIGLDTIGAKCILALDCFSDVVDSATYDVYRKQHPDAELMLPGQPAKYADFAAKAEWDTWGAVGNAIRPILDFWTKIPRYVVMISHAKDISIASKDVTPPPFYAFNAGTRTKSDDSITDFGLMWMTRRHRKPLYASSAAERANVTSRGQENLFKDMDLNDAAIKLFSKLLT